MSAILTYLMQSEKSAYYTYKYLPFVCGGFIILVTLLMHIFPESATVNGEPGPPDHFTTVIMVLIGIVLFLIPFLYIDKLVLVEVSNQCISIKKGDARVPIEWMSVASVELVPFLFPPLYKLKLKNYDGYFLFNTKQSGGHALFYVWDWSDMGEMIKKKKKELGI